MSVLPANSTDTADRAAQRNRVVRPFRAIHYQYPRWAMRPWFGMPMRVWLSLLLRHRFAISLARLPTVLLVTAIAPLNSLLGLVQSLIFGRRIRATKLAPDPVFIIGHWRSGTTFLHELLSLDERFVWPTTFECFAPRQFLVSRWAAPLLRRLSPQRRPMDSMRFGLDRPQEDEWAIAMLGIGSPYETVVFPDHRPVRHEFLPLDGLSPRVLRRWHRGWRRFLQAVQFRAERGAGSRNGGTGSRPLLLKSPTHTARLPMICEMFPQARFIHVTRDPEELFASTARLWTVLFDVYGVHKPHRGPLPGGVPSIEEYVLRTLPALYRNFAQARSAVPRERWYDMRFEDLVRDPVAEVEGVYRHFRLGAFAAVRPKMAALVAEFDGEQSAYDLPRELREDIRRRWRDYPRSGGDVDGGVEAGSAASLSWADGGG